MKRHTFIIILDLCAIALLIGGIVYLYQHIETIEKVYGNDVCVLCEQQKGASCVFPLQSTNEYYQRVRANLNKDK